MSINLVYDQAESSKFQYDSAGQVAVNTISSCPKDIRYDTDDHLPIYIGLNFLSHNASTSDTTWTVLKVTYSGISVTRYQKLENIAWDDRVAAFA